MKIISPAIKVMKKYVPGSPCSPSPYSCFIICVAVAPVSEKKGRNMNRQKREEKKKIEKPAIPWNKSHNDK